jgi:hypothetical protein
MSNPGTFPAVRHMLLLATKADKSACLNDLYFRQPLVAFISQRSEEVRLYNVV